MKASRRPSKQETEPHGDPNTLRPQSLSDECLHMPRGFQKSMLRIFHLMSSKLLTSSLRLWNYNRAPHPNPIAPTDTERHRGFWVCFWVLYRVTTDTFLKVSKLRLSCISSSALSLPQVYVCICLYMCVNIYYRQTMGGKHWFAASQVFMQFSDPRCLGGDGEITLAVVVRLEMKADTVVLGFGTKTHLQGRQQVQAVWLTTIWWHQQ